ncbi:hypothetical protein HDU96_001718 [Phlyctochytrium bullatum]|nr:hypothetical protein HDU96_001718 [Phlyctochytrium bullatum]
MGIDHNHLSRIFQQQNPPVAGGRWVLGTLLVKGDVVINPIGEYQKEVTRGKGRLGGMMQYAAFIEVVKDGTDIGYSKQYLLWFTLDHLDLAAFQPWDIGSELWMFTLADLRSSVVKEGAPFSKLRGLKFRGSNTGLPVPNNLV